MATTPAPPPVEEHPTWHVLSGESVLEQMHVEPAQGLTSAEAEARLAQYGPNRSFVHDRPPRRQPSARTITLVERSFYLSSPCG